MAGQAKIQIDIIDYLQVQVRGLSQTFVKPGKCARCWWRSESSDTFLKFPTDWVRILVVGGSWFT